MTTIRNEAPGESLKRNPEAVRPASDFKALEQAQRDSILERRVRRMIRQDSCFERQMDLVLAEAVRNVPLPTQSWMPPCNVFQNEEGFYIQLALPGWQPHHISLETDNQTLTVTGNRCTKESGHYYLKEFGGTTFLRIFTLPAFVDQQKARAIHKDGLLTICFLKHAERKSRQGRILIEVA
jgi:HSP20 family protein